MPVLCEETTLHPMDLLDGDLPDQFGLRWWALYTKARQEKAVARYLLAQGTSFYLPLIARKLMYHGRRVVSRVPLFPGYVFMYGSEEARTTSLASNRLSRVLAVNDPEPLFRDLKRVCRLIQSKAPLTPESRLVPGKRVRIRYGSMAGIEGTILKRRRQTFVVVSIDFIQQGASVEVEDHWLELAE